MRKPLIAVIAAAAVLTSGVAVAQEATSSLKVTLSPNKAGTTKKPKATKVVLVIKNNAQKQTAAELKIVAPKGVIFTTKDFKKCSVAKLGDQGPAGCPSGSQVGPKTKANALAAVSGTNPAPVVFETTPYATGAKSIAFYLRLTGGNVTGVATGTIKGQTLTVKIPENPAQQLPAGVYNGLVDITANLWVKSGKSVVKLTDCPSSKKLIFKNTIKFVANPNPPEVPTDTATATVNCK